MATQQAIDQIARSISFEVEAIPQDNTIQLTSTANTTPLNVKIKVRKKQGAGVAQNAVISIPTLDKPGAAPERVRLVSSDQTIMSFNVFMEKEEDAKAPRKAKKGFFGFFKPGSRNDDDAIQNNNHGRSKSLTFKDKVIEGSASRRTDEKNNEPPMQLESIPGVHQSQAERKSNKKGILGKCKPGGCLDPPFGEDKYAYDKKKQASPVPSMPVTGFYNEKPSAMFKTELSKKKKIIVHDVDKDSLKRKSHDDTNSPSYASLVQEENNYKVTETFLNSLITYPPALTVSEQEINDRVNERNMKNKISTNNYSSSLETSADIYFYPSDRKNRNSSNNEKSKRNSTMRAAAHVRPASIGDDNLLTNKRKLETSHEATLLGENQLKLEGQPLFPSILSNQVTDCFQSPDKEPVTQNRTTPVSDGKRNLQSSSGELKGVENEYKATSKIQSVNGYKTLNNNDNDDDHEVSDTNIILSSKSSVKSKSSHGISTELNALSYSTKEVSSKSSAKSRFNIIDDSHSKPNEILRTMIAKASTIKSQPSHIDDMKSLQNKNEIEHLRNFSGVSSKTSVKSEPNYIDYSETISMESKSKIPAKLTPKYNVNDKYMAPNEISVDFFVRNNGVSTTSTKIERSFTRDSVTTIQSEIITKTIKKDLSNTSTTIKPKHDAIENNLTSKSYSDTDISLKPSMKSKHTNDNDYDINLNITEKVFTRNDSPKTSGKNESSHDDASDKLIQRTPILPLKPSAKSQLTHADDSETFSPIATPTMKVLSKEFVKSNPSYSVENEPILDKPIAETKLTKEKFDQEQNAYQGSLKYFNINKPSFTNGNESKPDSLMVHTSVHLLKSSEINEHSYDNSSYKMIVTMPIVSMDLAASKFTYSDESEITSNKIISTETTTAKKAVSKKSVKSKPSYSLGNKLTSDGPIADTFLPTKDYETAKNANQDTLKNFAKIKSSFTDGNESIPNVVIGKTSAISLNMKSKLSNDPDNETTSKVTTTNLTTSAKSKISYVEDSSKEPIQTTSPVYANQPKPETNIAECPILSPKISMKSQLSYANVNEFTSGELITKVPSPKKDPVKNADVISSKQLKNRDITVKSPSSNGDLSKSFAKTSYTKRKSLSNNMTAIPPLFVEYEDTVKYANKFVNTSDVSKGNYGDSKILISNAMTIDTIDTKSKHSFIDANKSIHSELPFKTSPPCEILSKLTTNSASKDINESNSRLIEIITKLPNTSRTSHAEVIESIPTQVFTKASRIIVSSKSTPKRRFSNPDAEKPVSAGLTAKRPSTQEVSSSFVTGENLFSIEMTVSKISKISSTKSKPSFTDDREVIPNKISENTPRIKEITSSISTPSFRSSILNAKSPNNDKEKEKTTPIAFNDAGKTMKTMLSTGESFDNQISYANNGESRESKAFGTSSFSQLKLAIDKGSVNSLKSPNYFLSNVTVYEDLKTHAQLMKTSSVPEFQHEDYSEIVHKELIRETSTISSKLSTANSEDLHSKKVISIKTENIPKPFLSLNSASIEKFSKEMSHDSSKRSSKLSTNKARDAYSAEMTQLQSSKDDVVDSSIKQRDSNTVIINEADNSLLADAENKLTSDSKSSKALLALENNKLHTSSSVPSIRFADQNEDLDKIYKTNLRDYDDIQKNKSILYPDSTKNVANANLSPNNVPNTFQDKSSLYSEECNLISETKESLLSKARSLDSEKRLSDTREEQDDNESHKTADKIKKANYSTATIPISVYENSVTSDAILSDKEFMAAQSEQIPETPEGETQSFSREKTDYAKGLNKSTRAKSYGDLPLSLNQTPFASVSSLRYERKRQSDDITKESGEVILDVAFQSYINNRNERVLKSFDSTKPPKRHQDDSISTFRSTLQPSDAPVKVPVDSSTHISFGINKRDLLLRESSEKYNMVPMRMQTQEDPYEDPELKQEQSETKLIDEGDHLQRALSTVYNSNMVPLQAIINNLKEDIDALATQQEIFRQKIMVSKKPIAVKISHTVKRCGCTRK